MNRLDSSSNFQANLPALTSLRFWLAMWVVLLHGAPYLEWWFGKSASPVMNFVRSGYLGVNVFFVLSGFILTYHYADLPLTFRSLFSFWRARFARIYPVYLLGALLFLPIALVKQELPGSTNTGSFVRSLVAPFAVALTMIQSWFPSFVLSWNPPTWSVSTEVFFYALFPFALLGVRPTERWQTRFLVLGIILLWLTTCIAPSVAMGLHVPGFSDLAAATSADQEQASFTSFLIRFHPLIRLPEFLVGMLAAVYFRRNRSGSSNLAESWELPRWLTWLAGGSLIAVAAFASPYLPLPYVHNGLWTPLSVVLILGLASVRESWFTARWMVRLGEASYAMYVLQWPIRSFLRAIEQKVLPKLGWEIPAGGLLFVYLTGVIVAGLLVQHYWEAPLRNWLRGRKKSPPLHSEQIQKTPS